MLTSELTAVKAFIGKSLQPCLHENWDRRRMKIGQTEWAINAYKLVDTSDALYGLLDRTLFLGLSRSALLIGPLYQARIALLHALNRLDQKRNEFSPSYAVVHLSGIIHDSELLALKAMARQLKIDFDCDQNPKTPTAFQTNLEFVLRVLRQGSRIDQPIIIILQEFEMFGRKVKHGLLYHLLDLAHNSQNQIAIIGITEHSDVVSLLETRVQSRLSNNRIVVQPRFLSLDELVMSLRLSITLPGSHADLDRGFIEDFNTSVTNLFDDIRVRALLKQQLEWALPTLSFFALLSFYIEQLETMPTSTGFLKCAENFFTDPISVVLQKLDEPEVMLLVGMWHLDRKGIQQCTFEMICSLWKDFKRTYSDVTLLPSFPSAVLMKAFENLVEYDLVVAKGAPRGCLQTGSLKRFQSVMLRYNVEDLRQRVGSIHDSYSAWVNQWINTDGIVR